MTDQERINLLLEALRDIADASDEERAEREKHFVGPKPNHVAWKAARMKHAETIRRAREVIVAK